MSWISQKSELDKHDRELLKFSEAKNEVFRIRKHEENSDECLHAGEEHCIEELHLIYEDEWEPWIHRFEDPSVTPSYLAAEDDGPTEQRAEVSSSINLIMGGKTSSLSKMPFSENTFSELMSKLKIHRSVVRAINRNTSCTFSRIMLPLDDKISCPRSIGTLHLSP